MKIADILAQLDTGAVSGAEPICLRVGPITLGVRCHDPLRAELLRYFADVLHDGPADLWIDLLEGQSLPSPPGFTDWAREPGKTGRKDAIHDLDDGRLVLKVRTGLCFLQSQAALIAFGPCAAHPNQVINFINTQILNICLREGWQICHAAAVTNGTRSLAISGLSGGGKSTSVLRLMEVEGTRFVTNDRLMLRAGEPPQGLGIPKHPRINPGTILHNPRLRPMLSDARLAELAAMAPDDLWELEEKHDLIIPDIYGPGRIQMAAPITDFWVLNWSRHTTQPARITPVDLATRPDLLGAIMKSAGPFFADAGGRFLRDTDPLDPAGYMAALEGVTVCEVSGGIDFDAIQSAGARLFAA